MDITKVFYRDSLALLTDLYQLTMAYGYWKLGIGDREAVFNLYFRQNPFHSGFSIACGLGYVLDYVKNLRFREDDIQYLSDLTGNDGKPLFEQAFLDYLADMTFSVDIDAIREGTMVFPHEPLLRVKGSILQCQLLETSLLNMVNFQTLIATKAARICLAAKGEPVLEFGLRRAQGIDGSVAASRAAYIGGCIGTSNVLAGKLLGIPVKGTHAHSWVMAFADEVEAFEAYAQVQPNNCIFLVDTYNTIEGVRHAVQVGKGLEQRGYKLGGIRLDSGDLAYLSVEARKILDEAGFSDAAIVGSNDLDEYIIASLKEQGAVINVWGVGTKLATSFDQPALGGVYKLAAIKRDGQWDYKVKLSEQAIKVNIPGFLQVRRYFSGGEYVADMIYDEKIGAPDEPVVVDPLDMTRRKKIPTNATWEDLLVPVVRQGNVVCQEPSLEALRRRTQEQLALFHPGVKRFVNPHEYPVGLERELHEVRTKLILQARGISS